MSFRYVDNNSYRGFILPLTLLLVLYSLTACSNKKLSLDGIDSSQWKTDKNGCEGYRLEKQKALSDQLTVLRGKSENELLEILGPPDSNELYERNQKIYSYHIAPAIKCPSLSHDNHTILQIRFSATNMAREVLILEGED